MNARILKVPYDIHQQGIQLLNGPTQSSSVLWSGKDGKAQGMHRLQGVLMCPQTYAPRSEQHCQSALLTSQRFESGYYQSA